MRGTEYTLDDVRKVIEMLAVYCQPGPNGERPKCLYRDLLIFGLTALRVQRVGKDPDARYQIAPDWRRRIELAGLNPLTLQIEDEKEFEATVAQLEWRRQQRQQAQDKRRKERGGPTKGYYAKGERGSVPYFPPEPPALDSTDGNAAQPSNGSNQWAQMAEQAKRAKEEALARLEEQRSGW
jgi:hypothetical protein